MNDTTSAQFLRRLRSAPLEWTIEAIVSHLLEVDPIELRARTVRALVWRGVVLPIEAARPRVAQRLAVAIVRAESIPFEAAEAWLGRQVDEAVDALRVDGLADVTNEARSAFLERLASCLGVATDRAEDAWYALHSSRPELVRAIHSFLPADWLGVGEYACDRDSTTGTAAVEAVRTVVRLLGAGGKS